MSVFGDIILRSNGSGIRKEDYMEIDYENGGVGDVIHSGEHKGVRYSIIFTGSHPMVLVECDMSFCNPLIGEHLQEELRVHGNICHIGPSSKLIFTDNIHYDCCFGWDYGTIDDWEAFLPYKSNMNMGNKRWTTAEIIRECKDAIDEYLKIKEKL